MRFYNFEHKYAHRIQHCTSDFFKPLTFLEPKTFNFILVMAGINVLIRDLCIIAALQNMEYESVSIDI